MESFQFGEVVILPFTYADLQSGKRRPALVLVDTGDDDILVAKITTQKYDSRFDVPIEDWNLSSLLAPSFARLHKLLAVEKTHVLQRVGFLTSPDLARMRNVLNNLV